MRKKGIIAILLLLVSAFVVIIFAIPGIIRSRRYNKARMYMEQGMYTDAIEIFSSLETYKESENYLDYSLLRKAVSEQDWKGAGLYAARLPGFLDSDQYRNLSEAYDLYEKGKLFKALNLANSLGSCDETRLLRETIKPEYVEKVLKLLRKSEEEGLWDEAYEWAGIALTVCSDSEIEMVRDESLKQIHERNYNSAIRLIKAEEYEKAEGFLEELGEFQESRILLKHIRAGEEGRAYLQASLSENTDPHELYRMYKSAGSYEDASEKANYYKEALMEMDYEQAVDYVKAARWSEAQTLLSTLGEYKDSRYFVILCENGKKAVLYRDAKELMENERYADAEAVFDALSGYRDSNVQQVICKNMLQEEAYQEAYEAYQEREYEKAASLYLSLGDYKNSEIYRRWIKLEKGTEQ